MGFLMLVKLCDYAKLRMVLHKVQEGFMITQLTSLKKVGMVQCPDELCLFRYLINGDEAFIIQYLDDSLIAGQPKAVKKLKEELANISSANSTHLRISWIRISPTPGRGRLPWP
jgi:hypothetical protein